MPVSRHAECRAPGAWRTGTPAATARAGGQAAGTKRLRELIKSLYGITITSTSAFPDGLR
jgi:hypothetical protein